MAYEIDNPLRGSEELDPEERSKWQIPADWRVVFIDRSRSPGNSMIIQFGSEGVSREEAERIVEKILAGLNA